MLVCLEKLVARPGNDFIFRTIFVGPIFLKILNVYFYTFEQITDFSNCPFDSVRQTSQMTKSLFILSSYLAIAIFVVDMTIFDNWNLLISEWNMSSFAILNFLWIEKHGKRCPVRWLVNWIGNHF